MSRNRSSGKSNDIHTIMLNLESKCPKLDTLKVSTISGSSASLDNFLNRSSVNVHVQLKLSQ